MNKPDQFAQWKAALSGSKLDMGERGSPPSGYFRRNAGAKGWEAFAVWRDDDGTLNCARNIFGTGVGMTADKIDEMFAGEVYSIPYKVYVAVAEEGQPWPFEHMTRLTLAEIKSGISLTPELARAKAGIDLDADNPRAVIGANDPPEDFPLERSLADRIKAASDRVAQWLESIGGAPKTKPEADRIADYATRFGELHGEAEKAFKDEKQPWLDGGRAVDAKWRFREEAESLRKRYLKIANDWIDREKARLAAESKREFEEAQATAKREAEALGEPVREVAAPEAPKITVGNTKTVAQRTRTVWTVTDLPAFMAFLGKMETPPPDLVATCHIIAGRLGAAGVKAPGIELEERTTAQ